MSYEQPTALPPILPVGTAVVTRLAVCDGSGRECHPRGTAGLIVRSPAEPSYPYRVRFPGGDEASFKRHDLEVLKHHQRVRGDAGPMAEHDLWPHVIYRCLVGSQAYGLSHDASDEDRRGIYLPPAERHWSLYGMPEQLESAATEEVYWELEKFLKLALKANPNVLEVLYSPLVEHATPLTEELLAMRRVFLSKLIYQTYNGYAMSQFRKLGQDLRNRGTIKWKHAMHLIRLLLSGITALQEHTIQVRIDDEASREALLAIRDGHMPWEEVDAWRLRLHEAFEQTFCTTSLPERPDYDAANRFLITARRAALETS